MIEELDAARLAEITSGDDPSLVLIDFWAAWCGPCRAIAPVFEQMAGQYSDTVKFAKADVQSLPPEVMQSLGIMGIPCFLAFKDGEEVKRIVGANPDAIREFAEASQ